MGERERERSEERNTAAARNGTQRQKRERERERERGGKEFKVFLGSELTRLQPASNKLLACLYLLLGFQGFFLSCKT